MFSHVEEILLRMYHCAPQTSSIYSTGAMSILTAGSYKPPLRCGQYTRSSHQWNGQRSSFITSFHSLTLQVRVTSAIAEHVIQGDLSPWSWTTVLRVWLRIIHLFITFKVDSVLYSQCSLYHMARVALFSNTECYRVLCSLGKGQNLYLDSWIVPLQQPGRISTGILPLP